MEKFKILKIRALMTLLTLTFIGCTSKPVDSPVAVFCVFDTSASFSFLENSIHHCQEVVDRLKPGDFIAVYKIINQGHLPAQVVVPLTQLPYNTTVFELGGPFQKTKKKIKEQIAQMERKKCVGTDIVNILNYIEEIWGGKLRKMSVLIYSDMGDTKKAPLLRPQFSPNIKYFVLNYLVPGDPAATFIRKKFWSKYFQQKKGRIKFYFPEETFQEEVFFEVLQGRKQEESWF